jgi:hypothetical protein
MPDLGEGTVDAEIVAWHVRLGDEIAEDSALVEVRGRDRSRKPLGLRSERAHHSR